MKEKIAHVASIVLAIIATILYLILMGLVIIYRILALPFKALLEIPLEMLQVWTDWNRKPTFAAYKRRMRSEVKKLVSFSYQIN